MHAMLQYINEDVVPQYTNIIDTFLNIPKLCHALSSMKPFFNLFNDHFMLGRF